MGRADFYDHGNPNMICDGCGQKFKRSELREMWDNTWKCPYDFELRQPQDKLRSFPDKQSFETPRPESISGTTFWDGSSEAQGQNEPSTDDFISANEVQQDNLGDGNGTICDVAPSDPSCP